MSVFDRLALGVANWNPDQPYGHRHVTCPRSEQEKIVSYCISSGIRTIDTAVAYNVDLSWVPTAFDIVMKVKGDEEFSAVPWPDVLMAHDLESWPNFTRRYARCIGLSYIEKPGVSLYDPPAGIPAGAKVVQVPYSPFDLRWEEVMAQGDYEWHVRSIFCQGKVFTSDEPVFVRFREYAAKVGLPVGTLCILFCLLNPHVDKVIIGVDSEQQLRDNLRFFHRLDSFGVEDAKVIDPRLWGDK